MFLHIIQAIDLFVKPPLGVRHNDLEDSAFVIAVVIDTPASRASLEAGDIILKMGDYLIDDKNPLLNVLMKFEPGERVIPTTSKGGEETALELTLVQRP